MGLSSIRFRHSSERKNDSNLATGKLGEERNLKFLYHYYYSVRGQSLESYYFYSRTHFLKPSLIYIHTLWNMHWKQIQYTIRKSALQWQNLALKTAILRAQCSQYQGLFVLQKGSLKRSLKILNSLSVSKIRITLQKSYLSEHFGNIQGVIVKD